MAKPRGYPGLYGHYPTLPDALRWQQTLRWRRAGSTPAADAVKRAMAFPNVQLHLNAPWSQATVHERQVQAAVNGEAFSFDFVIAGTGYSSDRAERPELAGLAPLVLRWRDRYTPAAGEEDESLGGAPSMWRDIPNVERHMGRDLLLADLDVHVERSNVDVPPDFDTNLYTRAIWSPLARPVCQDQDCRGRRSPGLSLWRQACSRCRTLPSAPASRALTAPCAPSRSRRRRR